MQRGLIFTWRGTLYDGEPFHRADRILEDLKERYRLGVVSATGENIDKTLEEIRAARLRYVFDCLVIERELTLAHYIRCMKEMGTQPSDTAVVDHRRDVALRMGKGLASKVVWFNRHGENFPLGDSSHVTITSLDQILVYEHRIFR